MKWLGRNRLLTVLMVTPSVAIVGIFLLVPLLIVVAYSFAERDSYGGVVPAFTFANYAQLLDPIYHPIMWGSLELAAINTILALAIGYPIAYFIAFRAGRWAPLLLVLILVPFWINFLIRISAWIVLLGRGGLINATLQAFGIIDEPVRMLGTYGAVQVGLLYAFLPSAVLPIYAALQPINRTLLEAAHDLGANPLQSFLRVTLPLSLSGVMAAVLFVFVPSMGVFAIPVLLGGGKEIIIGNLIVQLFLEFRNIPLGAAVSVILLLASSLGILLYMRALRKIELARS